MTNEDKLNKDAHLIAYDLLNSTAEWLENPDNEVFGLLEENDNSLKIVANACIMASSILKQATVDMQLETGIEDTSKKDISSALEKLQALANEFDESGDKELIKRASVLDEIMLTIAADTEAKSRFKQKMDDKIADIKKRIKKGQEKKGVKTEKAPVKEAETKTYLPNEHALSTRYCPDHPGQMTYRKSDGIYQCALDGKEYNYKEGYTLNNGDKVSGTSADLQTDFGDYYVSNSMNPDANEPSRT